MKFSLLGAALAFASGVLADVYYATPNPTYDPTTGAEVVTAAKTADGKDVEAWSLTNCFSKAKAGSKSVPGDRIVLLRGVYDYSSDSKASGSLFAAKDYLTICGETGNRDDVVIRGNPEISRRCFLFATSASISSLTITNFVSSSCGGGIYVNGKNYCVISNVLFASCSASDGGGVYGITPGNTWVNWDKMPHIFDSKFVDCHYTTTATTAGHGGGGVFGSLCVRCTFIGCSPAEGAFTGSAVRGGATFGCDNTNCTFIANSGAYGAVCGTNGGSFASRVRGCTFIGNKLTTSSTGSGYLADGTTTYNTFICNTSQYAIVASPDHCIFASNVCRYAVYDGLARNSLFCFNDCSSQSSNSDGLIFQAGAVNCTIVSNVCPKVIFGGNVGSRRVVNVFMAGNVKAKGGAVLASSTNGAKTTAVTNCVADVNASASTVTVNWTKDTKALSYVKWGANGLPCGIVRNAGSKRALIDQGAECGYTAASTDLANNPRVFGGVVDIGCFEWPGPIPGIKLFIK